MTAPVRSSCVDQQPRCNEMVEEEEDDVKIEIAVNHIIWFNIWFIIYFTVLFDAGQGSGCLTDQSCTRGTSLCFSHWSTGMCITTVY